MYPRGTPHAQYPKLRGGTILISPHLPFTLTGLFVDGSADCLFTRLRSQPLNCWGQAASRVFTR